MTSYGTVIALGEFLALFASMFALQGLGGILASGLAEVITRRMP
jgi:hypothetical protein